VAVPVVQPGEGRPSGAARGSALGPGAAKLSAAVARAAAAGRRRRAPGPCRLVSSPYRAGSWRAQRVMHRSAARWRLLVSGRGVGKTHGCAYELLQLVMDAPPGAQGAVLAPTLTHAEAARDKLRELAAPLGVTADAWVATKRLLNLPGGRSIKVFSADRKEVVRGPSIVALWVDEGAYLSGKAIESSLPALRTPGSRVKLLISTTPAGKNWVWDWWDKAAKGKLPAVERFRFRGDLSPYNDPEVVELYRATASPEKFAQEYLAEFVDNLLLVFPDREGLFVDAHPARPKARAWLGVDLGKKDHTACALANEWQEAAVVGRWNEDTPGFNETTYWAQTYDRVEQLARDHGATVVVDTGGAGGAAGAVLAEHLRSKGIEVVEVKTSQQGTKAKIVEQARADVQWKKLKVLQNEHAAQLDYEMSRFQGIKRQIHGQEVYVYEGPQVAGEFDDCVISLCLANWGRVSAEPEDRSDGGIAAFKPRGPSSGGGGRGPGRVGGRGYMLR
jgi:hypothetical protein